MLRWICIAIARPMITYEALIWTRRTEYSNQGVKTGWYVYHWSNEDMHNSILGGPSRTDSSLSLHIDTGKQDNLQNVREYQEARRGLNR